MEVLYSFPARSSAPRRLFFQMALVNGVDLDASPHLADGCSGLNKLLHCAVNCSRLRSTAARLLTNSSPLSTLLYCLANCSVISYRLLERLELGLLLWRELHRVPGPAKLLRQLPLNDVTLGLLRVAAEDPHLLQKLLRLRHPLEALGLCFLLQRQLPSNTCVPQPPRQLLFCWACLPCIRCHSKLRSTAVCARRVPRVPSRARGSPPVALLLPMLLGNLSFLKMPSAAARGASSYIKR